QRKHAAWRPSRQRPCSLTSRQCQTVQVSWLFTSLPHMQVPTLGEHAAMLSRIVGSLVPERKRKVVAAQRVRRRMPVDTRQRHAYTRQRMQRRLTSHARCRRRGVSLEVRRKAQWLYWYLVGRDLLVRELFGAWSHEANRWYAWISILAQPRSLS